MEMDLLSEEQPFLHGNFAWKISHTICRKCKEGCFKNAYFWRKGSYKGKKEKVETTWLHMLIHAPPMATWRWLFWFLPAKQTIGDVIHSFHIVNINGTINVPSVLFQMRWCDLQWNSWASPTVSLIRQELITLMTNCSLFPQWSIPWLLKCPVKNTGAAHISLWNNRVCAEGSESPLKSPKPCSATCTFLLIFPEAHWLHSFVPLALHQGAGEGRILGASGSRCWGWGMAGHGITLDKPDYFSLLPLLLPPFVCLLCLVCSVFKMGELPLTAW